MDAEIPSNDIQTISDAPVGNPSDYSELDAALSKSFPSNVKQDKADPVQPEVKEDAKNEKADSKGDVKQDSKPEIKNEQKTEEKKEIEKPVLTPEQIDALKPQDKGAWGAIKAANKTAHKMIEQERAENAKLKAALAEKEGLSKKEMEALKSEKANLEKYRAMIDLEADPEFIAKYDAPIEKAVQGIKDMIMKLDVKKETVDAIDFSDPAKLEQILRIVSENKDRFTAAQLERKMSEHLGLVDARNQTLKDQKEKYRETIESKKKESFAKSAEGEGRMIKFIESNVDKVPFLKKMEIKDGAPQGEIDAANKHNTMVDEMTKRVHAAIKAKEPEDIADLAISAVAALHMKAENEVLKSELKKAQDQIKAISVVNSEGPRQKPSSPARNNGSREILDTDSALESHFSGRR